MRRLLIALTLAGAALRFATLDLQSFWYDEAVTVRLLHMDLAGMLSAIPNKESTPPLYYVLAWLWTRPFGTGEVGLRSLSALLGTAAIPVFYVAARELCSRRAALVVAALAAFNPLLVWYSQEARSYALLVLLSALSLWGFARLLRRPDGKAAALWAVASALAVATHYFAVFLIVPELIWLLWTRPARRPTLAAGAFVLAVGLALLPLAVHQRSLDLAGYIGQSSLASRFASTGKSFLLGYDSPFEVIASVIALLVAAAAGVVGLTRPAEDDARGARVAAGLGGAAVALPLGLAIAGADYLQPRNLLVAWLPLAVVVAAGLLAARSLGTAATALICGLGLASAVGVAVEPTWQRDDWRGIARAVGPSRAARAVVVQPANGAVPLGIYLRGLVPFPANGARVREIAVVHPVRHHGGEVHPSSPPRPPPLSFPAFGDVVQRESDSYTVVLLRAPAPVSVGQSFLLSTPLVRGEPASLLLQRARP
jgi:mannosyltransferase